MSLFKIYSGTSGDFPVDYPLHEGYAYFFEDSGELKIDTATDRVGVNATRLVNINNTGDARYIDFDEVVTIDDTIDVQHGGTGVNELTLNAVLIGNGTNAIKVVPLAAGDVVLGDATNGIKGLQGAGAFYAATAGAPQFGTLPLSAGGTGAQDAAGARRNLDVYSKSETDNKVAESVTLAYPLTIPVNGFTIDGMGWYAYSYNNTDITCGKNGDVPPMIICVSGQDEYDKIDHAEATPRVGIKFYYAQYGAPEVSALSDYNSPSIGDGSNNPSTTAIELIIIDNK